MYYCNVFVVNERHGAWAVFFKFMVIIIEFLNFVEWKIKARVRCRSSTVS